MWWHVRGNITWDDIVTRDTRKLSTKSRLWMVHISSNRKANSISILHNAIRGTRDLSIWLCRGNIPTYAQLSIARNICNLFLQIYSGTSVSSGILLNKFCNTSHPEPLTTPYHHAVVEFHSDDSGTDGGFQIHYTVIEGRQFVCLFKYLITTWLPINAIYKYLKKPLAFLGERYRVTNLQS